MKLYVANSTRQSIKHWFRVPGQIVPRRVMIPSGQQVEIPGVRAQEEIDAVIQNLQQFGARSATELSNRKIENFPGLIYSIDKPVSVENYEIGAEAVNVAVDKRAADEAVKSAKAFDAVQVDKRTKRRLPKQTEVTVTQDLPRGQKPSGSDIHMKVTVGE